MRQQHQNNKAQVQEPSIDASSKPACLCMMTRKDVTKIGKIGGVGVKIEEDQSESSED